MAVMAGAFFGIDRITPFLREFSLEDKTIMHPHSPKDSVPMWVVGVSCILVGGFMCLCMCVCVCVCRQRLSVDTIRA